MPRRRRSHPLVSDQPSPTKSAVTYHTSPALVRRDLWRVATICGSLLAVLGAVAYWQQQSEMPAQIGHALRLFLGF